MIQLIKLSQIRQISNALRTHKPEELHIQELAKNIESVGLQNAFTVTPRKVEETGETYYVLADGARRFTAMSLLAKLGKVSDEIMLNVQEGLSDNDILALQISGNATVKKTISSAFVNALYHLSFSENLTEAQLADRVKLSIARVRELMSTLILPDDIRALIDTGLIKAGNALTLASNYSLIEEHDLADQHAKAQNMTNEEFKLQYDEYVVNAKARRQNKTIGFIATKQFIGKQGCETILDEIEAKWMQNPSPSKTERAVYDFARKLFSLDEESIAVRKAEYDRKEAEKKTSQEEKKKAKAEKSLQDLLAGGLSVEEIMAKLQK